MTIVIAEHRLAWCADLADRFIVFDHGAILGEYEASDFLAMSEQRVAALGLRASMTDHTGLPCIVNSNMEHCARRGQATGRHWCARPECRPYKAGTSRPQDTRIRT